MAECQQMHGQPAEAHRAAQASPLLPSCTRYLLLPHRDSAVITTLLGRGCTPAKPLLPPSSFVSRPLRTSKKDQLGSAEGAQWGSSLHAGIAVAAADKRSEEGAYAHAHESMSSTCWKAGLAAGAWVNH